MSKGAEPVSTSVIKSAQRVLAILEYFKERQRSATVGDIAGALRLPQSSVSMLVKSLVSLGYLEHGEKSRLLRPSYRVADTSPQLSPAMSRFTTSLQWTILVAISLSK